MPDPYALVPTLPDPRVWTADLAASHPDPHALFRDIELDLCDPKLATFGVARLAAALKAATDTQLADLVVKNGTRFYEYFQGMAVTAEGRPYLRDTAEAFAGVVCDAYALSTGQVPQVWAQRATVIDPPGMTLR
jgi:hypothetical protein